MTYDDFLFRVRDPHFVLSYAKRTVLNWRTYLSRNDFSRIYRIVAPHTMLSSQRLRGLYDAVRYVVTNGIPGEIVECGTARGGSAALMGLTLRQLHSGRGLCVFDAFDGSPAPTEGDPDWAIARSYVGRCHGELEDVRSLFARLGILGASRLVKGLFQDTLPQSEISQIALLHLDGDWYESIRCCLESLYHRVSPGGIIQIDDYGYWAGARRAVDEFMQKEGIEAKLRWVDYEGRQLTKLV
jgi:hypothetical protein